MLHPEYPWLIRRLVDMDLFWLRSKAVRFSAWSHRCPHRNPCAHSFRI
ncbi:hypothetical protein D187_005994 [Cystobacter fuscus DSM 2262]|uniref:Uncharacterized protein n=1 Tax=Cystobacter fuscus (strain ATCC 25194 / DSM 2262 / NBRC 100088 / M29) TaxID=1242864 RepID=S9PKR8_CYSF2|nr:hypothetical protein D187_005994 [Cystobacter fuscus DSM 2262]